MFVAFNGASCYKIVWKQNLDLGQAFGDMGCVLHGIAGYCLRICGAILRGFVGDFTWLLTQFWKFVEGCLDVLLMEFVWILFV